ncbi:MAG: hypothetical protein HYY93_12510 [Planctomycetes bacterium]|nr:hypothetical protein [Planctomycetota bacterium]
MVVILGAVFGAVATTDVAFAQGPIGTGRCDVSSNDFPDCLCIRNSLLGETFARQTKAFTITLASDQPHVVNVRVEIVHSDVARFDSPSGPDAMTFNNRECPGTLPVKIAASAPNHPGATDVVFYLVTAAGEKQEVRRYFLVVTEYTPQIMFQYGESKTGAPPSHIETSIAPGHAASERYMADSATSRASHGKAIVHKSGSAGPPAVASAGVGVFGTLRILSTVPHCPNGDILRVELKYQQKSRVRYAFEGALTDFGGSAAEYKTTFPDMIGEFPGEGEFLHVETDSVGELMQDTKTVSAVHGQDTVTLVRQLIANSERKVTTNFFAKARAAAAGGATSEFDAEGVTLSLRLLQCLND